MQQFSTLPFILVCLFGLGSWLALNGIWVELPNLIHELPEGWNLASYVTVICQLGNIGTLIYILLRHFLPKEKLQHCSIVVTTLLGAFAFLMFSQYWSKTTYIFHENRSMIFFVLVFFVSIVDCTSSVTFLPFMAILPDVYLSALYIGESMTAFVPGVVALIQGSYIEHNSNQTVITTDASGDNGLLFSAEVFFIIMGLIMLLCPLSYLCILYIPSIKALHLYPVNANTLNTNASFSRLRNSSDSVASGEIIFLYPDVNKVLLLAIVMVLNTLQNGIVAAISSYAYQPYGNLTYHLSASLGAVFAALACLLYLWVPAKSPKLVYMLTLIYVICTVLILSMALESPNPWLKEKSIGGILAVLISIVSSASVSYAKLAIATILKNCEGNYLLRFGIVIQLGSFIGAIIMFPLVNFTSLFKTS